MIVDREFFSIAANDFCVHLCVVVVRGFLEILDLLAVIGFDLIQVGILKETGEKFDEFLLFGGAALLPVGAEGTFGHLSEIKPVIDYFFEFLTSLIPFVLSFQSGIVKDRYELVDALAKLILRYSRDHYNRSHEQQNSQHEC